MSSTPSTPPLRQIRAQRPSPSTITVYQAYSDPIATSALTTQSLLSSPLFSRTRMTWIKPSWCWVCYRSGYSYKDAKQARILALEMTVEGFDELLSGAVLAHDAGTRGAGKGGESEGGAGGAGSEGKGGEVRVQWDPERGPRLERLGWRSVQIGIPGELVERWAREWVVGIRDVTERARGMKEVVEGDETVGIEELVERGLHPVETVYEVNEDISKILQMS